MKTRKLTVMALLCAAALTIFIVESQIPPIVPVPGVKLGLSNIITVYAVWALGGKAAGSILFVRIFLGAAFSGNFGTILYSAAGGFLAIMTVIGLKKILPAHQIWVAGSLGAIAHSIGQMIVAVWVSGTPSLLIYLPVLLVCSIITGLFTGLCAQLLIKRGKDLWKTFFK